MNKRPRRAALPRHLKRAARPATLAAFLLAIAAVLAACSSPATSSGVSALTSQASASASSSPAAKGTAAAGVNDWAHALQVLAKLDAAPNDPVVVLLGGSAARESTVSDKSWAAQVAADGGPSIPTYNLGSRNRTLEQDIQIVRYVPKGSLVFIGINVGRFTDPKSSPTVTPAGTTSLSPYKQHKYSVSLSDARKRLMLQKWLVTRYPEFKKHFDLNSRLLTALVKKCADRGLHPVLLELPRNTAIIGTKLAKPVSRVTAAARSVAAAQGIPWRSFVAKAHVPDASFYDLWHLLKPGRVTWQRLLSAWTAELLKKYQGS